MAEQNTFQILLFNDAKMIGEHSNSMHEVKSATLEIANLALLTPCIKFEKNCGQIPSFEVL